MMKYAPVGTAANGSLKKKKEEEVKVLGIAALINLVIVVMQVLVLGHFVPSLTLQAEMMHTASDLLVNVGAWWVAYKALTMTAEVAAQSEKKFMYLGIVILLLGAAWTTHEAIEKLVSNTAPVLQGEWLIAIGMVGGAGNFFAHYILNKVPHKERSHKHQLVHLHVIEDLFLAMVVIVSGVSSKYLGWSGADPYLSFIVVGWVCKRSYSIYQMVKSGKKLQCC